MLIGINDAKTHGGIRFDTTPTMTGAGTLYPFVVSVMGLNERELPGRDFITAKKPGYDQG